MTLKLWFLLILLSILWGGSFLFNEIALRQLLPMQIVATRVCLAAMLLWLYIWFAKTPVNLGMGQVRSLMIMAAINNVIPFLLIAWGQTHINSGLTSILNTTVPLFAVVLAHFLTADEKISRNKIMGVVFGFIGVVVLIGPDTLLGEQNKLLGQLAVLAASVSYALSSIFGKRLKSISPVLTSASSLTAASIYMLIMCWWFNVPLSAREYAPMSTQTVLAVLMLAVFSTACAYLLYFRILAQAGATNITLVAFLIPISAILLGVTFLDETLSINALAGMALIFTGLVVIDGRLRRRIF